MKRCSNTLLRPDEVSGRLRYLPGRFLPQTSWRARVRQHFLEFRDMPFDALPSPDTGSPVTETPSLERLAWVLEHPESWPVGFEWDYTNCRKCAVGMAERLYGFRNPCGIATVGSFMGCHFGIPHKVAVAIFLRLGAAEGVPARDISPLHVASAIREYLASRR
jgi:hypothetical protein